MSCSETRRRFQEKLLLHAFHVSNGERKFVPNLLSCVMTRRLLRGRILMEARRLPVIIPTWLSGKFAPFLGLLIWLG